MVKASALVLISEEQPHGVFESHTETRREVFCTIRSVGMREAYEAMSAGLDPEIVFVLSDYAEYKGEKKCEWNGNPYKIVRVYSRNEQVELTAERVVRGAGA